MWLLIIVITMFSCETCARPDAVFGTQLSQRFGIASECESAKTQALKELKSRYNVVKATCLKVS